MHVMEGSTQIISHLNVSATIKGSLNLEPKLQVTMAILATVGTLVDLHVLEGPLL